MYAFSRGDLLSGQVLFEGTDSWIEGGDITIFAMDDKLLKDRQGINFNPPCLPTSSPSVTEPSSSIPVESPTVTKPPSSMPIKPPTVTKPPSCGCTGGK